VKRTLEGTEDAAAPARLANCADAIAEGALGCKIIRKRRARLGDPAFSSPQTNRRSSCRRRRSGGLEAAWVAAAGARSHLVEAQSDKLGVRGLWASLPGREALSESRDWGISG